MQGRRRRVTLIVFAAIRTPPTRCITAQPSSSDKPRLSGTTFFAHGPPVQRFYCFHGRLSWNRFVSRGGATSRPRCWWVSRGRRKRSEPVGRTTQRHGNTHPWSHCCYAVCHGPTGRVRQRLSPRPGDGGFCSFSADGSAWARPEWTSSWEGLRMQLGTSRSICTSAARLPGFYKCLLELGRRPFLTLPLAHRGGTRLWRKVPPCPLR